LLDRVVARAIKIAHKRPLPPPTEAERQALAELRRTFSELPAVDVSHALASERAWLENMNRLRELVLKKDPRRFLRWDVVARTMFVAYANYVREELRHLKALPDWETRWRPALSEDAVGDPLPFLFYPSSSANLIHHAYHLAQFEARTGLRVNEMEHIVEFGGGYGGMARLVHRLGFTGRYVIFDLPAFAALQRFFLKSLQLPVLDARACFAADGGICSVSDLESLQALSREASGSPASMFLATWSLSEAPVSLRANVFDAVKDFKAYLIGFQDRFGEVDNLAAFDELQRSTSHVSWQNVPFEPMRGNRYLIGKRSADQGSSLPSLTF
jgi:hypothetical protein